MTEQKKAGRPRTAAGPARMVSIKLKKDELEELRRVAAELKISQADVMRLGIRVAARSAIAIHAANKP